MTDHRARQLAALFALGAAVVFAHRLPGFSTSYVDAGIRNGLHVLGFAAVAFIVCQMTDGGPARRALLAVGTAIVLGSIAEYVQQFVGRQLDPVDLLRDVTGAAIAVAARLLWPGPAGEPQGGAHRGARRVLSLAVASIAFLPLAWWSVVYAAFVLRLPEVADLRGARDERLAHALNASVVSSRGADGLEVMLMRSGSSGILLDVVAKDWSAYHTIVLEVAITGAADAAVDVAVSDGLHPGSRTRHRLGARPAGAAMTELRFALVDAEPIAGRPPLSRKHVERLWILGRYAEGTAFMRLDRIRLE